MAKRTTTTTTTVVTDEEQAAPFSGTTHILIILDISGSMGPLIPTTAAGLTSYLATLGKEPDSARMRVSQVVFDHEYRVVYTEATLAEAHRQAANAVTARGNTALYDAVGRAINTLRPHVAASDRALCAIISDGQENASHEYTQQQVLALVQELTATGRWTFAYLGAVDNPLQVGAALGVPTANVLHFAATPRGNSAMYAHLSSATRGYTGQAAPASAGLFDSTALQGEDDADAEADNAVDAQ